MASSNPDQYRSHMPKSFVIISGQECLVKDYALSLSARGEASSVRLSIPLDGIDSEIFIKNEQKDQHVEVDLYTGYLLDTEDIGVQIEEMLEMIKSGKAATSSRFAHRFSGYVLQPEWLFGDERMITLNCNDWTQTMREYAWEKNLQDGETEVRNVIAMIQKRLTGIKIIADKYSGSLKLGEKDPESKKYTYQAAGKKHYEILQDCAMKMGKTLIVDKKNIYITNYKEQPSVWTYYYGSKDSQFYKDLDGATPFKRLTFRYGEDGDQSKSNVVVELSSRTTSKKGKNSLTHVRYPENAPNSGLKNLATGKVGVLTKYIKKTLKNNLSEQELKVLAENIYKQEVKNIITGNIDVDFANPFVDLLDAVTFVTDDPENDLRFIKDVWFSVSAITENYSAEGLDQTIDFNSDPDLKNTLSVKVAPKTLSQLGKNS